MSRRLLIVLVVSLVVGLALPASAVIAPSEDNGEHPQVGQLLFYVPDEIDPRFGEGDPGAWFNCSGTLFAADVVVTAGHCTWGVGDGGSSTTRSSDTNEDGVVNILDAVDLSGDGGTDIWFTTQEIVDYSILPSSTTFIDNGGNAARYAAWSTILDQEADWTSGTAHPHPDYDDDAFFLHDVGVVLLDAPVDVDGADYGELPDEGFLDQFFAQRRNETRFTVVGYGLQSGFPRFAGGDTRFQGSVMLVDATGVLGLGRFAPGTAAVFSNNPGKAHRGGTCFGDSGGPVFYEDTTIQVGVTSFGNRTCTGWGGVYRLDQADDIAFIQQYL